MFLTKFFIAVLLFVSIMAMTPEHSIGKGPCECAVFSKSELAESDKPSFRQTAIVLTCDESGQTKCQTLCVQLAKAAKESGPGMLCEVLGHSDPIKPHIFSRHCNLAWLYTGISCDHTICCHDGKPVPCNEEEAPVPDGGNEVPALKAADAGLLRERRAAKHNGLLHF